MGFFNGSLPVQKPRVHVFRLAGERLDGSVVVVDRLIGLLGLVDTSALLESVIPLVEALSRLACRRVDGGSDVVVIGEPDLEVCDLLALLVPQLVLPVVFSQVVSELAPAPCVPVLAARVFPAGEVRRLG